MSDDIKNDGQAPSGEDNATPAVGAAGTDAGDTATAQGTQGDDSGSEPAVTPPNEDKEQTDADKSYEHLRKKMNDQGVELSALRSEKEKISSMHQTTAEELDAYKKWYEQYYPVLDDLYKDEAIRTRIETGVKPRAITEQEAEKIAERKLAEYRDQNHFEKTVDRWVDKHPDVKGKLAKDIYEYLERNDLNPTPEILDTVYTYCTKDKLKAIGVKEKALQEKKVSDATVGGGGPAATGKPKNSIDDLFAEPISNYYPGAKL